MCKAKQAESLLSSRPHMLPLLSIDQIQGDHSRAKQHINFLCISERNTVTNNLLPLLLYIIWIAQWEYCLAQHRQKTKPNEKKETNQKADCKPSSSKWGYHKVSRYHQRRMGHKDVHWEELACKLRLRAKPPCRTVAWTLARSSVQ